MEITAFNIVTINIMLRITTNVIVMLLNMYFVYVMNRKGKKIASIVFLIGAIFALFGVISNVYLLLVYMGKDYVN
jgi:hypothetical protein